MLGPQKSFVPTALSMHLSAAVACLSPRWPKRQQPASLRGGSPLPAVLRHTEQAQPSGERARERERERKREEETHREKDQLAQQLSRALLLLPAPPPSAAQEHTDACLLPPSHSHMSTASSSSHTRALPLDDPHLLQRSVAGREDGSVAQAASGVSPLLDMSFSAPPSLPGLPPPPQQQTGSSERDLQLHYQRPKAQSEAAYMPERGRERGKTK